MKRIFISAAEESADRHGAALIRRAALLLPDCHFYGLVGPHMRAAGAGQLYDFTTHAAMLAGVFSIIGRARQVLKLVRQSWQKSPPDIVVLLDSPELNLRLAARARQLGIPVLYYIAPQTWAARAYRNRRIARDVTRLACILPFEESYFRNAGLDAEFVGHPLFEQLRDQRPDPALVQQLRADNTRLVALLPGSRQHVIDAVLPRQLDVIRRLRQSGLAVSVAVSCAAPTRREQINRWMNAAGIRGPVILNDNASLLTAADLVLVASGTATLEVAFYRRPMVVMYDAGRLLRWLYRLFGCRALQIPHLALVNILAQARVVPEFMPFVTDTAPVARVAADLLRDQAWRNLMIRQLDELVQPLEKSQASTRVCELIDELLARRPTHS
jgi:lipid-A-disaccharide synthase